MLTCCCSFWVVCADMAAQYTVPDPGTPGKMFMNYQGLASYLSSGGQQSSHFHISVPIYVLLTIDHFYLTRRQLLDHWHRLRQLRHHLRLPHHQRRWQLRWRLRPGLLQEPSWFPPCHPALSASETGGNLHGRTVPAGAAVWSLLERKRRSVCVCVCQLGGFESEQTEKWRESVWSPLCKRCIWKKTKPRSDTYIIRIKVKTDETMTPKCRQLKWKHIPVCLDD